MGVGTGEVWLGEHVYCGPRLCIALGCGDKTDTNSGVIDEDGEIDLTLILPLTGKSESVSCGVTAPFSWVLVCRTSPLRGTLASSLRSPAEGEGHQGFPPPPEKDLESPSSTRLESRFPYHDSRAFMGSSSSHA